ncbi:MAG TPA: beta-ketoacyl synthase N-terminal-like domain-containing protein, partial [Caulobacterales bacterium]|nr:beta-ketoacyl synthase N-terminal-like domain-containing protein [Caulobacterales bacterium]
MSGLRDVFITGAGAFLPGDPVGNDRMEDHLGRVGGRDSLFGKKALRWNGVESRHYAMQPDGRVTHSNAEMCARAVEAALDDAKLERGALGFLAAATTQGDYLVPGHATAVHGELGRGPLEIASFQSVCGSSLMAAKAAWLQVRAGEHDAAAACAGEFSSRWFRPSFYEGTALVDEKGRLRAEADFLRFTLSDGAGAIVLEPDAKRDGVSLRIDFIDIVSLADRFDPCMWAGAAIETRADLKTAWSHVGPRA